MPKPEFTGNAFCLDADCNWDREGDFRFQIFYMQGILASEIKRHVKDTHNLKPHGHQEYELITRGLGRAELDANTYNISINSQQTDPIIRRKLLALE